MSRDIVERLLTFETYNVEFHRIALNMDQIEKYNPPPNPTKLTDSRATGYIEQYGHECWELDALEPQVITNLIDKHVRKYRDDKLYKAVIKQEQEEKAMLEDLAANWTSIAANWDEIKATYCD